MTVRMQPLASLESGRRAGVRDLQGQFEEGEADSQEVRAECLRSRRLCTVAHASYRAGMCSSGARRRSSKVGPGRGYPATHIRPHSAPSEPVPESEACRDHRLVGVQPLCSLPRSRPDRQQDAAHSAADVPSSRRTGRDPIVGSGTSQFLPPAQQRSPGDVLECREEHRGFLGVPDTT